MSSAERLLDAWRGGHCVPLPSLDDPSFSMERAFAVADEIRSRRIAHGERPVGYKIGFSNRGIWQRYGVHQPIWGSVWDTTATLLEVARARVSLAGLCQPRLEPEVVFGFVRTPQAGMSTAELQGCLAWVAHGFEIVHTHFDGWRFTAPDAVADFALHGRLVVGPRVPAAGWSGLDADLAALRVALHCDGECVETGVASIVLDGPLQALRLWVDAMAARTPQWPIRPGDFVTTGTITDAWPLVPGQVWHTTLSDERLAGLTLETGT